ncbi:MAG: iron chelate uptake ABC transporter family permease subunit, partial [Anaerolineaceae bacterium]|nr:iron chelate uptake ABC transporter family permease subunit [Anaerolineaceae bacterium]
MEKTGRFLLVMLFLALLLFLGLAVNANTGTVSIPAGKVFSGSFQALRLYLANIISGGKYSGELAGLVDSNTAGQILFRIRLPRVLLAALLGGALSLSGYLLQVFFRNPIVGPFVLGISSGAKMVVGTVLIFLSASVQSFTPVTLMSSAFIGSMLITLLVLVFSQKVRDMSMLLVIGIMIGYICSAVTD